ncbi:alpha/beta hydrolase [Algoriphagus sp. H41]|uniref:Proline iminopeptidase n=1 Tax=Algoriphagus oliviformis TaxID=2811231 RepID=A0ABS3CC17_9BACT|nr:alpha/beta hydrolase [Algoriphagus oliviformis]MBN7813706.1 alpha/beta hydrolase [Algoriphagus oliviformis]
MKVLNLTILFFILNSTYINAQDKSINEERFVSIGGIEQWITIKGEDKSKPVILFLHGGPGSTMSQFENNIYGRWEDEFVLVHWDQRGAGKTYGRNFPSDVDEEFYVENPLKVEQMAKDGIELTKYILEYLDKQKVILVGTSWGSVLGMKMALKCPELFHLYIGHSQVVNFSKNISYAYKKTNELAISKKDDISIELLNTLGKPPYDNARSYGQLLRIIKKYEGENSIPAPESWWKIAPKYDNEKDSKARYDGDDYSFINFVGHEKLGIPSMVSDIDFERDGLVVNIPVYLIQGEQDILTSKEVTEPYYNKIKAPKKEYFLVPGAAHGLNKSVVDMQYQVIKGELQF